MNSVCTIFCTGVILKTIQLNNLYNDSKTFVDMPLKYSPDIVMENFLKLPNATTKEGPSKKVLKEFLADNFSPVGSDLIPYQFSDWQEEPPFLNQLKDNKTFFDFAKAINKIWLELGRKAIDDVKDNPSHHTLLYTPNPIVVPGGRFRESYYWDTYWIVKGLIVSDMLLTARGVVENLLYFVERYGKVPNGGRIYYLTRSQPPLLSEMVRIVYEALVKNEEGEENVSSIAFLTKAVPLLDKEYMFWKNNRTSSNNQYEPLSTYNADTEEPRPESYREDYLLANDNSKANFSKSEREKLYKNIAAAAESGWDFSSRWFRDNNIGLASITTTSIIPVDLNAYLFKFEINMYMFKKILNYNIADFNKYLKLANARYLAMEQYLWNEKYNQWMDFDMATANHTESIAASNFIPLSTFSNLDTTMLATIKINNSHIERAFHAFRESGLVGIAGIKATTVSNTKQQWDSPNAWAPMVDIIVESLVKFVKVDGAKNVGFKLASQWLATNLIAYQKNKFMYEKYNADEIGVGGDGGEYVPQLGFGWSNGVALVFINELWFSKM